MIAGAVFRPKCGEAEWAEPAAQPGKPGRGVVAIAVLHAQRLLGVGERFARAVHDRRVDQRARRGDADTPWS
jgi:hypothetical protein